VPRLDDD